MQRTSRGFGILLPALNRLFLVVLLMTGVGLALDPPVSGRKYLLSVGINQYPEKPLRGCVNDASAMREALVRQFGFEQRNTTLLTDYGATRAAILSGIRGYVDIVSRGDLFVFFYSGHGSLWPDSHSPIRDESANLDLTFLRAQGSTLQDGRYDSTIVPIDANVATLEQPWGNMILDDELYSLFSQMTARGAFVILLSDSCNSGSLAKSINIDQRDKFVDPETVLGRHLPKSSGESSQAPTSSASFQGRYLAITSSRDDQVSLDGTFGNRPQGAFTFAMLRAIADSGTSITYRQLFSAVLNRVTEASNGVQTPSLDARYYDSSLDLPVFSLVSGSDTARLKFLLRSRGGDPIPKGNIAIFPRGVTEMPGVITNSNTLAVVATRENGEAVSPPIQLTSGDYLVKALADGFNVFIGKIRIQNISGQATALIVLDPQ